MHAASSSAMTILHCDFFSGHRAGLMYWIGLKNGRSTAGYGRVPNVRVLLKSPNFSKSQVIDSLLSVKLISKERNHAKGPVF